MVAPTDCSILRENVGASIARPSECNNIHQEHSHINYNLFNLPNRSCRNSQQLLMFYLILRQTMLQTISLLRTLSVIESVQSTYQIACDTSDTLE